MAPGPADARLWRLVHDAAGGPSHGIGLLHAAAGPDTIVAGPAGHALVPAGLARTAVRCWPSGDPVDDAVRIATPVALAGTGLVAMAGLPGPDGSDSGSDAGGAAVDYLGWLLALAWLRLGTSRSLVDAAMAYLAGRTVSEAPFLRQQLVQAQVAGAVTGHLTVRATLAGCRGADLSAAMLADAHEQITVADRAVVRLVGGQGFLTDGPGQSAYLSELLADVYVYR